MSARCAASVNNAWIAHPIQAAELQGSAASTKDHGMQLQDVLRGVLSFRDSRDPNRDLSEGQFEYQITSPAVYAIIAPSGPCLDIMSLNCLRSAKEW